MDELKKEVDLVSTTNGSETGLKATLYRGSRHKPTTVTWLNFADASSYSCGLLVLNNNPTDSMLTVLATVSHSRLAQTSTLTRQRVTLRVAARHAFPKDCCSHRCMYCHMLLGAS